MCSTPGAVQSLRSNAYTRPAASSASAATPLLPFGTMPFPGPRDSVRVAVLTSRMPFVGVAMRSRPEGWYRAGPGDSPSPFTTTSSICAPGSTIDSLPSAFPGLPASTTYNRLSAPRVASLALVPVRGIESTVGAAPPLVGRTLSQLGPDDWEGAVPFTTKTKPATTTTVRG